MESLQKNESSPWLGGLIDLIRVNVEIKSEINEQ